MKTLFRKFSVALLATIMLLGAIAPTSVLANDIIREDFTIFVNSTSLDLRSYEVTVDQWGAFIVSNPYQFATRHLPGADLDVVRNMSANYMLVSMIRELPDHNLQMYRMEGTQRVRDDFGNVIWITGPTVRPTPPDTGTIPWTPPPPTNQPARPSIILYVNNQRLLSHRLDWNNSGQIILPSSQDASRSDAYDWVRRNLPDVDANLLPLNLGARPLLVEDILVTFPGLTVTRYRVVNRQEVVYTDGHIVRITLPIPQPEPTPPTSNIPDTGPVRPPVTPGIPGQVRVYFYNDRVFFPDQQPEIISGRVMVPIGPFATAMGGRTSWYGSVQGAIIELGNPFTGEVNTVSLRIGIPQMYRVRNGERLTPTNLEVAPFIQNSRTMVPVRAISEAFNFEVYWDGPNNRVLIRNSTS